MAAGVPPPPLNSPSGSYYWLEWYTNLTNFLNGTNIPWSNINFTNAYLSDITHRNHNMLSNIQGGNASGTSLATGNAWHITGRGTVVSGGPTGFPTGWTVSHGGTGTYTVVHNLGLASPNLGAIATSNTTGVVVGHIDTSNTAQVVVYLTNPSGTALDGDFSLIILT